jgi:hypothetical protein
MSAEQITNCPGQEEANAPASQVLRSVMDNMATLAKSFQIAQVAIARIMIQVRGGEVDACGPHIRVIGGGG